MIDGSSDYTPAVQELPKLAPPVETYEEALQKGHAYMQVANDKFKEASELHLRLEAIAVDLARANFLQTRALSYYQYAALIKND